MRRLVLTLLVFAYGCSTNAAPSGLTTTAARSTTTTAAAPTTTTTRGATTTAGATASTAAHGPSAGEPAGYDIEDFVPLVEDYFAVRNWALEHPDEVTEDFLAMVIEPDSAEMRLTLSEIQDLLDQDAHYEGLSETFELIEVHVAAGSGNPGSSPTNLGTTIQFTDTKLITSTQSHQDTLRRAGWTLVLRPQSAGTWLVSTTIRNPFAHKPESP